MIKEFKDRETENLFNRIRSRKLQSDIQRIALRKLRMLNSAISLDDLKAPPGNRLKRLKGKRIGQFSIRINDQWRICFTWRGQNAYEVEITDYH